MCKFFDKITLKYNKTQVFYKNNNWKFIKLKLKKISRNIFKLLLLDQEFKYNTRVYMIV